MEFSIENEQNLLDKEQNSHTNVKNMLLVPANRANLSFGP